MATNISQNTDDLPSDAQAAADVIRAKVARIYSEEPNAQQEIVEVDASKHRSRHQQYMYELSNSGKDLATIQTEWHAYYQSLSPAEKHQVWQEFYASQKNLPGFMTQPVGSSTTLEAPAAEATVADPQRIAEHKHEAKTPKPRQKSPRLRDVRSTQDAKETVKHKVSAGGKLKAKHHLQSLAFGLGMGFLVVVIFLFGFFNEAFIAPFIQPSRTASATPIIVGDGTVAPTNNPEVIIPKINVEIPTDYSATTIDENAIENNLENGVVHYPTTASPGQNGNAAYFGHSSNNIFNKGKYKFAFVLLHTLENGDTFYLTNNGKVYVYKVFSKTVVDPSDVGVLDPIPGHTATATLITCDPPGTSLHRLVVVGDQISPDPTGNTASTTNAATAAAPTSLPGNGPTLWTRLIRTAIGKAVVVCLLLAGLVFTLRWLNTPRRAKQ